MATDTTTIQEKNTRSRTLRGVVVSDAMDKTVVVRVERFVKTPKYQKYVKKSKRFKAHDENNEYTVGSRVVIEECAPISKDKTYKVVGLASS